MKQIEITLDELTITRIDTLRGDVPRSAWIRRALQETLNGYTFAHKYTVLTGDTRESNTVLGLVDEMSDIFADSVIGQFAQSLDDDTVETRVDATGAAMDSAVGKATVETRVKPTQGKFESPAAYHKRLKAEGWE